MNSNYCIKITAEAVVLPRIAAYLPMYASYARSIVQGAQAIAAKRGVLIDCLPPNLRADQILQRGPWRGIIMMGSGIEIGHDLLAHDQRVVLVNTDPLAAQLVPSITVDAEQVARHILRWNTRCDYTELALITRGSSVFGAKLRDMLEARIKVHRYGWSHRRDATGDNKTKGKALQQWHRRLPEDCGICIEGAVLAARVQDRLRPVQQVCAIGGDAQAAALAQPPLAYLDLGFEQIGQQAARALLARSWPPPMNQFLAPAGLETTSARAHTDDVAGTLRQLVQAQFPARPDVPSCARALGCSRSHLERQLSARAEPSPSVIINTSWVELATIALARGSTPAELATPARLSNGRAVRNFINRWSPAG